MKSNNFIDENGDAQIINDEFMYHGVNLVTVKDKSNKLEVYEPCYGTKVQTGKYDILFSVNNKLNEIGKDLDEHSYFKESCENEKNYLPEIAFNIIKGNKKIRNILWNKIFSEKIEKLRASVMDKVKKGVAIGIAFAACTCFAPKLAAEGNNIDIQQTEIKHFSNTINYYQKVYQANVIGVNEIVHMLNEDAKEIIHENFPLLKEGTKRYNQKMAAIMKELSTSDFGYNYLNEKFFNGGSRLSVEDSSDDMFEGSFYSGSNVLVTAEANRYIYDVQKGNINPKIENNQIKNQKTIDYVHGI